jgi:hypothetical protein
VGILERLCEAVLTKIHQFWSNDWILNYDNAPAHKAVSVNQFLSGPEVDYWNKMSTLFPDLAPNVFWLFQKIKSSLEG